MLRNILGFCTVAAFAASTASLQAQVSNNPFATPIEAEEDIINVNVAEFASLPDIDGEAARMMQLVDEPGTGQLFVIDMTALSTVSVMTAAGLLATLMLMTMAWMPGTALSVKAVCRVLLFIPSLAKRAHLATVNSIPGQIAAIPAPCRTSCQVARWMTTIPYCMNGLIPTP